MAFSTQQNFVAELDGTTVAEILKKLDYKIIDLEGRKKVVSDILNSTGFFKEYFSGYFRVNITNNDSLSVNNNVCLALEKMTNYILNSSEVKKMDDKEKSKYIFYTDSLHFDKKINKELSIESMSGENGNSDNVIHFLKRDNKNYKRAKTQKITNKDLKRDDFLGEVLRSYQIFKDFLTEEIKKGKESKFNRFTLTKVKNQIENDMIYSKDHLLGVWGYELKSFSESTEPNIDVFDFTNINHLHGVTLEKDGRCEFIKGLLYLKATDDYMNDFNLILIDLQNLVNKTELSEEELFILSAIQHGLPKKVVADLLDVNPMKITRSMVTISEKVALMGDKYDCDNLGMCS